MSELTAFRDHARAMATAEHKPECALVPPTWWWKTIRPHPDCAGCNPDADRALFARLADEVDAYLAGDDADVDLFGDETPLPEVGNV